MRKVIIISVMIVAGFALANANPIPPFNVSEYSTSPPWIELTCYAEDSLNLSGLVIHTIGGNVVVDNGVFSPSGASTLLDSGDTSGFRGILITILFRSSYFLISRARPTDFGWTSKLSILSGNSAWEST